MTYRETHRDANREPAATCQGKHPFQSKRVALQVARKAKDAHVTTYKCPFCHAWHIGGSTDKWHRKPRS